MTVPLYNGADAAFPGEPLPPGTQLLSAYVGLPGVGRPDTPHVWTADEWNGYIRSTPNLRVLPIYVHDYDNGDPIGDADNAVQAVLNLGWAPNMPGTSRRIIFLDYEILVDPDYVAAMERRVYDRGFRPVPYGSSYFVRQNPAPYGYWDANYTFHRPTQLPPGSVGVQYEPGTWDLSVFGQLAWDGAGRGLRHG